jgi:hypothetical protein
MTGELGRPRVFRLAGADRCGCIPRSESTRVNLPDS